MRKVLVIDSTYETCREAVDRAFEAFPIDVRGKKVAVKMNALKAGDPHTHAYVTDYRILRAVLEKLETMGPGEIVAGDSVGTESYGNSEYVFEQTRLKETAGSYYRNFNKNLKVLELEKPFKRKVAVLKDVVDADVYISVPKMKTHGLTILSGSVKNNFGLLTGAQKAWYHYNSIKPEVFAEILIEMYKVRPPDLVIMDGIMAMEGYGPSSPEVRWVNKVVASDNAVALDTVLAKIIGFQVDHVPYLRLARAMELGETDLGAIDVIGDATTIEDYHRPGPPEASYSYRAGIGSGSTSIVFYRERVSYRPDISAEKCQHAEGCSSCVDVCPTNALSKGTGTPLLESSECILCSACREVCEFESLEFAPDEALMESLEKQEATR